MKNHQRECGEAIGQGIVHTRFSKALVKAATASNAQAGFRGSEIYPLNPAKINKKLFYAISDN